jgi:DNA primase
VLSNEWVEDLKRRVDLVELGRRYGITWDTRGKTPKACCPFHSERTPSFHVLSDPRSGVPRFVCYGGCGRSWSAVAFLVDGHKREFLPAIEELAGLAGITVPKRPETEQARAARETEKATRSAILSAIDLAQAFFVRALSADTEVAVAARAYVERRELGAAVEPWGLGLAPPGAALIRHLDEHQVAPEIAEAAWLTQRGDDGHRYAFLRNRLTIPWRDRSGRVVLSHVGRLLGPGEPKYLNAGEIPGVYVKGELVFGIHAAAEAIRRTEEALVVEGQLSCITPHLHGLANAVACGGKAFSPAHARLLLGAGARRAVFLLDGDDAGRKGAAAAVPIALAEGLQVLVAELPQGLDPDDVLRKTALCARAPA